MKTVVSLSLLLIGLSVFTLFVMWNMASERDALRAQLDAANASLLVKEEKEQTCVTGRYLTEGGTLGGTVAIGEVQICGGDLVWTAVYGPSLTAIIENRDREIEVLKTKLEDAQK